MPKLTGPLFSLHAANTLGKTLTYASWRGISYVRSRVVPNNPDTVAQQAQRANFANLSSFWSYAGTRAREPWTAFATGQPFTDRNALLQKNIPAIYQDTDMNNFIGSPGFGGAPPPVISSVTPGVGQLTVNITAPTVPSGWTIVEAVAIAFADFDPTAVQTQVIPKEGFDATAAYAVIITGLPASLCQVRAWMKYTKPDGSFAYSVSVASTATPT